MKKLYFLLFFSSLLFGRSISFAQLVGGNGFLQGQWLEVGVNDMGCFGTCSSPVGYHPHGPECDNAYFYTGVALCDSVGDALDACYDWGHDGWTVGTPCEMGDYTIPGVPMEGWGMQYNGTEYRNWANYSACTGPFGITGTIITYTNAGRSAACTWSGARGGLSVVQETRVDTEASWVVITAKIYNTTAAAITGVYYERTCDPDNTSFWPDGSSETENVIVHQNEDVPHRVEIGTYGTTHGGGYTYNRYDSWMSLATKDCRARCYIINPAAANDYSDLYPETGVTESDIWSGAADFIEPLGDSDLDDVGIVLLFNIGTIAAGDSAAVSYAYVYDGPTGIDSAFPEPALLVAGDSLLPTSPVPAISYDTFNACSASTSDTFSVNIEGGGVKNWTWSHWTWSPSTGLSATTGIDVTITTGSLPPVITYTITGTDSTGTGVMDNCQNKVFYLTIVACNQCTNNSPCQGDTLQFQDKGDSTGASYAWRGPGGFTSTQQDPFIYPATPADDGEYYVVRTILGVRDTDSTYVTVHPLPIVTASSNSPLCSNPLQTLYLAASPASAGETFTWTGPNGFTSSLQNPTIPTFGASDTGLYKVVTTTPYGCMDSTVTDASLIPPPPAPVVTGTSLYCQGSSFDPFIVTDSSGTVLTTGLLWYTAATGGTGSTTPLTVNTAIPGYYVVYVSHIIGSCEGPRASFGVRVRTTPPAPTVTGTTAYCQYAAFTPMTVHTTPTGTANWYTSSTGGTASSTEPTPNTNVVPAGGAYQYWVSQTDSGCESSRTLVTITIHPKPAPPIITPTPICQYQTPGPEQAAPSGSGDALLWYGPGVTVGTGTAPTPSTLVAPDTIDYYVDETSVYGCVSDSAEDVQVIKAKPAAPRTVGVEYCQGATPSALNAEVDSAANSHLVWYQGGTLLPSTPVPPTTDSTPPGNSTWYVAQVINGCESDSSAVTVTVLYTPVFGIVSSQSYVCQYDSILLSYSGPDLAYPSYTWALPEGGGFAGDSRVYDSSVLISFDSAVVNNYVTLTVTDDSGKCVGSDSIRINIVSQPTANAYTPSNVCLGDTVALGLSTRADDAYSYEWYIDYISMLSSNSVTIISSSSSSGGPFSISWVDSGMHVIEVQTYSEEGCRSAPTFDTVDVHPIPNANFEIISSTQSGCLGDTVEFAAIAPNYNDLYTWSPSSAFENENTPTAWGRIEDEHTIITLTVTDPFGCTATTNMELSPNECCTVWFPNAFTPNADGKDDFFRPLYNGYHHFQVFEIMNRWGQVIFTAENSNVQWDGTYNGVPQDMGTYYYYLKYDCGNKTMETKGSMTLIR